MNRFVVPIGVVALTALFFGLLGGVGWDDPPPRDAEVDAEPLPLDAAIQAPASQDAFVTRVDAAPLPPPKTPLEAFRRYGVLGRDVAEVDTFLAGGGFKRVADQPEGTPTYDDHGTRLRLKVEGGEIVAVRADFPENAASAHLTALSWVVCGQRDHIRLHWEEEAPGGELLQGRFEQDKGPAIYYRGMRVSHGEAPYGPAYVELSRRPFTK